MALSKESISQLPEQDQEIFGKIILDDLAKIRKLRQAAVGSRFFLRGLVLAPLLLGLAAMVILNKKVELEVVLMPAFVFLFLLIVTSATVLTRRLDAIVQLLKIDAASTPSDAFKHPLETTAKVSTLPGDDA